MRGVNSYVCVSDLLLLYLGATTHLDVLAQQPVEEVYVGGFEVDKVLELLDGRGLHSQEPQACSWSANSSIWLRL
jgi:hypothetical protein